MMVDVRSPLCISITTSKSSAECILLFRSCAGYMPSSGPDVFTLGVFFFPMVNQQPFHHTLEKYGGALKIWMQLSINKDSGIQVLLSRVAEVFVLIKYALEELVNVIELLVCGINMTVDFILH